MIRLAVLALVRRYPAPILERVILTLGVVAIIGQSVLIAWILASWCRC